MDSSSLDTARRVLGIGAAGGPALTPFAITGFVPETASAVRHCLLRSAAGARLQRAHDTFAGSARRSLTVRHRARVPRDGKRRPDRGPSAGRPWWRH